jgi:hypothetical protein
LNLSKKKPKMDEPFTPEQLAKLESKGDKDVQLQRQKEGLFQRYNAKRDSKSIAKSVKWKRCAGIALVISLLILLLLWIVSWLLTTIGDLVISVDSGAAKKGITISANEDGSDPQTKLYANMVKDVTNITYDWLPATLDMEGFGNHNGRNYMAYTFQLTNNGKETIDYVSTLKAVRAAKSADEACRIMVYRNGEPAVYAKENMGLTTDDNSPEPYEKIFKKVIPENYNAPSEEEIEKAAEEPQNKEPVDVTDEPLEITQWDDKTTVFTNTREGIEPGETDKYTIVMWIEGEDPECLDVIRDGYVKLMWFFNVADEEL